MPQLKQRSNTMMEITQSTNTPASMETGRLNSKWKRSLFLFYYKRAFLSKVEGILSAAAGHEGNGLPSGNHQYQVLAARADELCTQFAERWSLDRDLHRGVAGFYRAVRGIVAGEPLKKPRNKRCRPVFQLSRRPRAQHLPQYETDVECAEVDQQTLQNVVMPAQGRAPHPTRLITVGKAAFDEFSPPSE